MRLFAAAVLYFAIVFAAGFALGPVRVLWLEPAVGATVAVLIEAPILVAAMAVAARWVAGRLAVSTDAVPMLIMGAVALLLVLAADFTVGRWLRGLTPLEQAGYLATPAGIVYAVALALFALMPMIMNSMLGGGDDATHAGLRPMTVVTGGSEGIGYELARRFARAGGDVMLVARRLEPLERAAAAIRAEYEVAAVPVAVDVTAPEAIAAIEAALAASGAYADVVVNSAGIGLSGPFHAQAPQDIERLVAVNIGALTRLTRHFLPGMRERRRGGILNIASLGSYVPGASQAAYYASKAYVLSLTEAIAAEVAGERVRMCALAPGPVSTAFHARMGADRALYRYLMPQLSAAGAARIGHLGYVLGLRVVIPGLVNAFLALAMRAMPHRIAIPIVGWLLKPRTQGPANA